MEDDDNAFQLFAPGANKRKRTQAVVSENGKGKHGAPTPATAAGLQPGSNINTDDKLKKKKKIKQLEPGSDGQDADATVAADGQQEEVVSEDMPERAQGEVSTSAAKTFKGLGLTEWLEGVCKSLGMDEPTEVQRGCIPAILAGRDVVGLAHTGSGKTAAFALPILQALAKDPYGVFAVVLTPTRELAYQISEQFKALGAGMSLKECVIIGGVDMQTQARELARRPHVVIATPGRLRGLVESDPDLARCLSRVRFLVLDEADRLLDPSFEEELRIVLRCLPPGERRQTLLFSATMTKALIKLQSAAMRDAHVFQAYEGLKTAERLTEQYTFIPAKVKEVYLNHLLTAVMSAAGVRSAIIFCSTCKGCRLLGLLLEELGLPAAALHSGLSQRARLASLARFKSEAVPLLLATDVASRGLDIPTVDLVINYDLPVLARDYVHRVGRTARAGRRGWALSFVTQYDVELVHGVESLLGKKLDKYEMPEEDVLKGITRVYAAKRAAMLRAAEQDGLDTSKSKKVKKAARGLMEGAPVGGAAPAAGGGGGGKKK